MLTVSYDAEYAYAGFWRRVLAFVLDYMLVVAVVALLSLGVDYSAGDPDWDEAESAFDAAWFLGGWLYYALMESSRFQGTLGKRALGMIVTDEQGRRIGFGRATGRYFGKLVSALILGIGFLMVAFTDRKQGLHDMIAGALVLHTPGEPDGRPAVRIVHRA